MYIYITILNIVPFNYLTKRCTRGYLSDLSKCLLGLYDNVCCTVNKCNKRLFQDVQYKALWARFEVRKRDSCISPPLDESNDLCFAKWSILCLILERIEFT